MDSNDIRTELSFHILPPDGSWRGACHPSFPADPSFHESGRDGMPYDLTIREAPLSVHITGDVPVTHTVLWANHRIACLEPYNAFRTAPGSPCRWTVLYAFSVNR